MYKSNEPALVELLPGRCRDCNFFFSSLSPVFPAGPLQRELIYRRGREPFPQKVKLDQNWTESAPKLEQI